MAQSFLNQITFCQFHPFEETDKNTWGHLKEITWYPLNSKAAGKHKKEYIYFQYQLEYEEYVMGHLEKAKIDFQGLQLKVIENPWT